VFTHDSIFVGEDGPTHQPVEHAAALRCIPGLSVFRPADGLETAMSWVYALKNISGPTALLLTRQTVPELVREKQFEWESILKGGYVLSGAKNGKNDIVIVATGSEVSVSVEAKSVLEGYGIHARVVSMPSVGVFLRQSASYRDTVLPSETPVAIVEAGVDQGWYRITRAPILFLGMREFGSSGPYKVLAEKYGFTGPAIAEKIKDWLK
jgi:transketolase